jgi:hypothetical protein
MNMQESRGFGIWGGVARNEFGNSTGRVSHTSTLAQS